MRSASSHVAVAVVAVVVGWAIAQVKQPRPPQPPAAEQGVALPEEVDQPATPEPADLSPEEQDNVRVYRQINRSVVNITTRTMPADDLLFSVPREGSGSGSVLDKKGHILTNY